MSIKQSELFLIRDEKSPILYAPLKQLSARLNESAVDSVIRRINGENLLPEDEPVIEILENHGFFNEDIIKEDIARPVTEVTLFISDGCNLRCRYCYASAEKIRHTMPAEVGKAAVDYIADNAISSGEKDIYVSFHGNGEPFTAFPVMKKICEYAKEKADNMGLKVTFSVASNGCFNDEIADWVMAWMDNVNISFDGPEDLQNAQRPFPDGSPSFPNVDKTLRRLNDAGKPFGIRTTLTSESVTRLPEIAAFIKDNYPDCNQLHVEPVWESGRSIKSMVHTPDAAVFVDSFIKAKKVLEKTGIGLTFSTLKNENRSIYFCSVSKDSFVVTADGLVTACYEVCEECDERAFQFIYGKYDPSINDFVFDDKKKEALHRLKVTNIPYCKDCFCKYHCAGDCPAKLIGNKEPAEHQGSTRCDMTRALTLHQIAAELDNIEE
jgi:uncharacterized protein